MENQDLQINLNFNEINSLVKLILYIKFESKDNQLLLYAGSPFINSALEKLLYHHIYYKDNMDDFFKKLPDETKKLIEEKIRLDELQENFKLNEKVKLQLLLNCAYPYKLE